MPRCLCNLYSRSFDFVALVAFCVEVLVVILNSLVYLCYLFCLLDYNQSLILEVELCAISVSF